MKHAAVLMLIFTLLFCGACTQSEPERGPAPPPPPETWSISNPAQSATPVASEKTDHLANGLRYARRGDFFLAVSEYKQALKGKPNDPLTHYYLGVAYSMLERTSKTSSAYSEFTIALEKGLTGKEAESAKKWLAEAEKAKLSVQPGAPVYVDTLVPMTAGAQNETQAATAPASGGFASDAAAVVALLDKVREAVDGEFTYEAYADRVKTAQKGAAKLAARYGKTADKDTVAYRMIFLATESYAGNASLWKRQLDGGGFDESALREKWKNAADCTEAARRSLK